MEKRCNSCIYRQWDPKQYKYKCCYRKSPRGRVIDTMYVTPSWCPVEEKERWEAKKKKMTDALEWLEKMEEQL